MFWRGQSSATWSRAPTSSTPTSPHLQPPTTTTKTRPPHVLPVFDLALAVASQLAMDVCQPIIEVCVCGFLGHCHDDLKARWLGLLDAAAAWTSWE